MKPTTSAPDNLWTRLSPSPRSLLIVAATFHLLATIAIYGLGRYSVMPGTIDTNGIAVSVVPDGIELREEAADMGNSLARGEVRDWFTAPSVPYLKLYSVSFAVLGRWFGPTILSAEPVNAFCYLSILVLIFKLGQEIFNRRAGLMGAAIVAVWPSFLLHTTQLLKDPLFLVGMLALILVNVRLIQHSFSWPKALLTGALGALLVVFVWLVRDSMEELLIATVALGAAVMIVQQLLERDLQAAQLVGMLLILVVTVSITQMSSDVSPHKASRSGGETISQNSLTSGNKRDVPDGSYAQSRNPLSRIAAHVGRVRERFVREYPNASSNIDSNVQLTTTADLIRYFPRATAIGFFSPFPNMWLTSGSQVGSAGRLLSGMETLMMYLVQGLAIAGLWIGGRERRYGVCLLWLVAAMGMISLGLVVVNVGTLYRLRYIFVVLLIILATGGAAHVIDWCRKKRSVSTSLAADA